MKKYRYIVIGSAAFLALGLGFIRQWRESHSAHHRHECIRKFQGSGAGIVPQDHGSRSAGAMPPAGRGGFGFARPTPPPAGAMPRFRRASRLKCSPKA